MTDETLLVWWKPSYWCDQFDYNLFIELSGGTVEKEEAKQNVK